MFASVIQGHVSDAAALRRQSDRWMDTLSAGAEGWLGTTQGVTGDGTYVAVVRFESEAAALASNNRPEVGEWFNETAKLFDGDITFRDCQEVDLLLGGDSDIARFVQVIEGRADRGALRAATAQLETLLPRTRPEILGGLVAWHGDGEFIQLVYFSDEAAAREGEARTLSPEDAEVRDRLLGRLQVTRFLDLPDPWFLSPGWTGTDGP